MERQQWMGALLRLHYEQHLSRGAACRQLGLKESTGYKFFRRFLQSNLPWPLPDEITPGELEKILYPSELHSPQSPKTTPGKRRRPNFSAEFKRYLAEQSLQPGVNVAQLAREHGINDNLLFNWRRRHQQERNKNKPDVPLTLLPVDILAPQHDIIELPSPQSVLTGQNSALCCEVVLPGGTVKLSGAVTPALLKMLFEQLQGGA